MLFKVILHQLTVAFLCLVLGGAGCVVLAKLHLLPVSICIAIGKSFPAWLASHVTAYWIVLLLCAAYPLLLWGAKAYSLWQEERYRRGYLLATAKKYN